jgi:PhnB protein
MASIAPWLHVRRGAEAVEYYKAAFGAEELHRHSDQNSGEIVSRLSIGGAIFWVADDVDHSPSFLSDMYEGHGWRIGRLTDPAGHDWEIGKPLPGAA